MRIALLVAAGSAALTISLSAAVAAPSTTTIDGYSFAGGKDTLMSAPLETGRSAAIDGATPRAFTPGDMAHAFATWGFAD